VQATLAATAADSNGFLELGLSEPVLQALRDVGYEAPTPIQAATIPTMLAGSDVLGQAQTGTGKTGAFALPVLSRIDLSKSHTQVLVLVPTRELAIQVAEAFQRYATHMKGFHVLPIYGGQSYTPQLKGLKRGAHVVVGTPGRVMDHMKRGTLPLDGMTMLILDEADEMLQMGFVDAIEWILEQSPPTRQIALFSATLPPAIRRIAQRHQRTPAEITIRSKTSTAPNIRQRYWLVSGMHKLDALTRILEVETFDAMLVFVRTKLETVELAERLEARGFEAAPLNGDIPQPQRERTIAALKSGKVDIVVATDVAARGLDVERVSHVVNYDVPYDSESYIHRIGRTGRAGRSGEAILFIAPRERNMLRIIERATRQQITQMNLPSVAAVNEQRVARFKQRIADTLTAGDAEAFRPIIEEFVAENDVPALEIAAALASLLQGSTPLLLPEKAQGDGPSSQWAGRGAGQEREGSRGRGDRDDRADRARGGRDRDERPRSGRDRDVREMGREGAGRDGVGRDGAAQGGAGRGSVGRDDVAQGAAGRDGVGRDAVAQAAAGRDGVGRDAVAQAAAGRGGVGRDDDARVGVGREDVGRDAARTAAGGDASRDGGDMRVAASASVAGAEGHTFDERVGRDGRDDRGAQEDRGVGNERRARDDRGVGSERGARDDRGARPADRGGGHEAAPSAGRKRRNESNAADDTDKVVFETFRLEVGHAHGVKPGNIVGAIANEAGLEGRHIGHVDIRDDHSFVDLPEGMPKDIFRSLKKVRVVGQELRISRVDGKPSRQH